MSWLEVNKILASIIVAVIILSLISIFGDILINQNMTQFFILQATQTL